MLKTIDRYVLLAFLRNYVLSLIVLVSLYVVLDMVVNFDEFAQVSAQDVASNGGFLAVIGSVVSYYGFQSFRIFNYLAGVIPIVAAAFTLLRMSRFNELVALLAAGTPLLRVAIPIVFASMVLNLVLLPINQELIVPAILPQLTRDRGVDDGLNPLQQVPDGKDGLVNAGNYRKPYGNTPASIDELTVVQHDQQFQPTAILRAKHAVFDAATRSWTLTGGKRYAIASESSPATGESDLATYDGDLEPQDIAIAESRGSFVDLLPMRRIDEMLSRPNPVGRLDLLRVKHSRYAGMIMNIVLVLLTIPAVLTREPTQLRTAAGKTFLLVGLAMGTIFITQNMAGLPATTPALAQNWPAIMAWLPIFIFAPVAIWLMNAIRT